ncbi:hypothetical protein QFW77_16450 [Luteimonas sp. RD2P54]|uniref:Uncharacterized protein n=1 Tax=Luteimonas endophytica TaxID=3042023 RepID=A0ABT6JEE6_9GAMM|nr:hypothetical protein [Luteimonas endophytica]MDH5824563.1 hypothetical protein [Luteimonas endophytica]
MTGKPDARPPANDPVVAGRRRARRTALAVGAIAVAIYVVFILSGALGR